MFQIKRVKNQRPSQTHHLEDLFHHHQEICQSLIRRRDQKPEKQTVKSIFTFLSVCINIFLKLSWPIISFQLYQRYWLRLFLRTKFVRMLTFGIIGGVMARFRNPSQSNPSNHLCFWMSFIPFLWFPSRSDGLSLQVASSHVYKIEK